MSNTGHRFRYWVELHDLRDGSTRKLELRTIKRIHVPTKKSELQRAPEERLQLEDGASMLEAANLDDLISQLCAKYPDGIYERSLHNERDMVAERAMDGLVRLLARAAVDSHLRKLGQLP
jgi:hypothetical protein